MKRKEFALCVESAGCEDLVERKVYEVMPDSKTESEGFMRIVDESGESYLYPAGQFVRIQLPKTVLRVLAAA